MMKMETSIICAFENVVLSQSALRILEVNEAYGRRGSVVIKAKEVKEKRL